MSDFRSHIAVIDYGMGNLHSVAKALEHVSPGARVTITSDPAQVEDADRVVFPGVGAIRDCMTEIQRLKVGEVVSKAIKTKPVLAICVGMQALMEHSEENGGVDCLGYCPGRSNSSATICKMPRAQNSKSPTWAGTMFTRLSTTPCGMVSTRTAASTLCTATM